MSRQRLFVLFLLVSAGAEAQWLNFPTPGTPRTRDGKPNLTAPAPRTADGKPDLSGVWMHEQTSVAEMKRLYGAVIDVSEKVDVPGMEIGTQNKYAFNILLDFKPGESPLRRDDKDTIGLDAQSFRDQFHRHVCVARQNLVKQSVYGPEMVNDDNRNTHIGGQVPQQPGIGVQATGRTAHANNREVACAAVSFH